VATVRLRLQLALLLSLAVHALLLLGLAWLGEGRPALPAPGRPLAVEVVQQPARRAGPSILLRGAKVASGGAPARGVAPPAAGPAPHPLAAGRPDAPVAPPNLFPQAALAAALPPQGEAEVQDAGPPAQVLAGRVQAWRLGALAEARVATGVDSYFSTLAHALRDTLGVPPPAGAARRGTPSGGQRWLQGWLAGLAEAEGPADPPPQGERLPVTQMHDMGGREGDLLRRQLGPMAPTQEALLAPFELFRKTQLPPAAVLRVEQDADGHLLRVQLLASSGDATFDAWAQRSAALALAAVPRPPAQGAGLHPDGTRSDWAFYRTGDGAAVLLLRVY